MKSPFREDILLGKTALITGGGSGICFDVTRSLGLHGAKIAIMGRRQEVLEKACESLREDKIECTYFAGDVRDPEQAIAAVQHTVGTFGSLDILLNGAAGNFLCPTEELSPNGFKTVIDIDLLGTFNMSKAAFEHLKRDLSSHSPSLILNISATLHYQGTLMQSHVMAAKAGIDALGRNMAAEWGESGIRVCTIAPGAIGDTEGMRRLAPLLNQGNQNIEKSFLQQIPLRRLGTKQDIAMSALFLASEAGSYITGEIMVVDGGQWLYKAPFVPRNIWENIKDSQ